MRGSAVFRCGRPGAPSSAPKRSISEIAEHVAPMLIGRTVTGFRELAEEVDTFRAGGRLLATAMRYGVTQAILHAAALASGITMAEVVQREYQTGFDILPVPLFAQTGDDRYTNVDKMILKEVDVLPHGLINEVETKLGADGGLLKEYIGWLRNRILASASTQITHPGCILIPTVRLASPFSRISSGSRTISANSPRRQRRSASGSSIRSMREAAKPRLNDMSRCAACSPSAVFASTSVVDEWCNTLQDIEMFVSARAADVIHVKMPDLGGINNTIEALLYVRRNGLRPIAAAPAMKRMSPRR